MSADAIVEAARAEHYDDSRELGEVLSDLWSAELCSFKVEYHAGMTPWVVLLEWTSEYGNDHHAEWTTYTWQFYGDSVTEALYEAVAWCEGLLPWEPCRECDGNGEWNGERCDDCDGTGLANAERGVS